MANPIDIIVTNDALKGVDAIIARVDLLDKKLQDVAQTVIDTSKKIAAATSNISPTAVNNKGADTAKISADIDALKAKYVSLNDTVQKKLEQTRLAEIRLQQQREKAFDSFDKNAKKEEAALKKAETAYQRIQNSVNILTKTYQDLAIRKELGGTLTVREEKQLQSLTTRINTYQTALKNTDAIIQKNGRNVGNYASGYNALGNSINQLTREAPAFANSINTGFMALSNNFPALFDAIKGIREQNALLIAQGKPTKSLFSQLVGGVFSFQTALSLGVTLLTLYGGTFVKWVQEVAKGKEGVNELKMRIDTLNKAFEDTGVATAVKNVNELTINIDLAKRGFLDKERVVKQYNDTIGKTTGLVTSLDEAEKELTANGDAYIKMTLYKAAANIALEEASKQVLAAEKSRRKSLEDFSNAFLDADLTQTRSKEQYNLKQQNLQTQRENRQKEEIKINEDAAKANIDIAKKFQEDAAKIASQFGFNFFEDTKEEKKKKDKSKRDDIEGLKSHLKEVGFLKEEIDKEINRLTTEQITGDKDALPAINFQLEQLIKLRKQLEGLPEADIKIVNTIKKTTTAVKELSDETKQFLKTFVDEFASNSGFASLISSFDLDNPNSLFSKIKEGIAFTKENWQASTVEIAEAGQEMYNFIANASKANFESEKERLQAQYDIALTYAGDNKAAQEKLAEDLEKKKKEIDQREAKAKKEQAIFNIAIDTAQAIVASLPNLVLAGIVAALGAIQIATVSAQKIPKFWMGGTHEGGLMMVNDGSGPNYKETVVTPDGKVMKPQGKNVIINAPKGTEIYTENQWQNKLSEMLQGKGIDMAPTNNYSSGLSKSDMYDVLMDTLGSQPQHNLNMDVNGFVEYLDKGGNKTILNRNRSNGKGLRFKN